MPTDIEHDPTNNDHQRTAEQIDQVGHHLLEMFAAVCAAPDDSTVAAEANRALRELERTPSVALPNRPSVRWHHVGPRR